MDRTSDDTEDAADGGAIFWVGAAVGWVIIVVGIRMGLHDREFKPGLLAKWVAGGLLLHDLVWLPVVAVAGALAAVALRRRIPLVLAWAAATTIVMTLIAWPFVRGYGRRADNPSALSRNYAHGLLVYIAVTWLIGLVVFSIGRLRPARQES
ncbi:MAG: hypothetical protein ABIZ69_03705 [Ilumatobacteraceae bacterium]